MTSLLVVVVILLCLVIPFEAWTFMNTKERYQLLKWLYIHLPSRLSRMLLPLYWKYFYLEASIMFWGRCFPTGRHRWYYTNKGLHCADCHNYIPNYNLTGSVENFPIADDLLDVLL